MTEADDAAPIPRAAQQDRVPPGGPPHRVSVPVNVHHWDNIAFLHWAFEPAVVSSLLPAELRLLTFEGAAWVGVTPFFIRVRPPGVGVVPPGCSFPETNLRTYVAGPDGRTGLWFLRMEVTAAWFVAALRALGLPYVRQRMAVEQDGRRLSYRSWPDPPTAGGGHRIVVDSGELLDPPWGGARERFLTARWGAYHRRGPLLLYTPVEHPPWPLRSATVAACEVGGLFATAGLPPPQEPPLAHFSAGVTVRVGPPSIARAPLGAWVTGARPRR